MEHITSADGCNFDLSLRYGVQAVLPLEGVMGHGKMLRDYPYIEKAAKSLIIHSSSCQCEVLLSLPVLTRSYQIHKGPFV